MTGRRTRHRRWVALVLALGVGVTAAACGSDDGPDMVRAGPAFHSAGPEARMELQGVLQSQAELIAAGNWEKYFELYVPTERARCTAELFGVFAEQLWAPLRAQAKDAGLTARLIDVKVRGFRADVDYQMVIRQTELATQKATDSYLKLGDRWFIEEQAC